MPNITVWLMFIPQIMAFIFGAIQDVEGSDLDGPGKEAKVLARTESFLNTLPTTEAQRATIANIMSYAKLTITAQVMINNILSMWKHKDAPPVVTPPVVPPVDRRAELNTELARLHGKLDEWNVKAESPERTQRLQNLNLKIDAAQAELLKLK